MKADEFSFEIGEATAWQPPVLHTNRLVIRPLVLDDLEALFQIDSNPNMTRYTLWDTHETREDTHSFIVDYAASRIAEKVPDPLAVVLRDTNELVGSIGCFWSAMPNGVMELGYNIGEPYWGRGYAAESCETLIAYIFSHFDVERLQARIFTENSASSRVAEKLGFEYEGTLRSLLFHRSHFVDVRIYSMLRIEWEWRSMQR